MKELKWNPHSEVVWTSANSLLETNEIPEIWSGWIKIRYLDINIQTNKYWTLLFCA